MGEHSPGFSVTRMWEEVRRGQQKIGMMRDKFNFLSFRRINRFGPARIPGVATNLSSLAITSGTPATTPKFKMISVDVGILCPLTLPNSCRGVVGLDFRASA